MSLITTCPACRTTFHVEPAQLAVHRGDVACGKCGHVFNALDRLTEIGPGMPAAAPAPEPEPPTEPEPAPQAAPVATPAPEAEMPPFTEPLAPPAMLPIEEPTPLPPAPAAEAVLSAVRSLAEPPAPRLETPPQHPQRQTTRWLLLPLALLLLLTAAAQGAYFLRSDLAVWLPQLRPALVQACASLGCTIELPRKEQLLSIDDSDLRKDDAHDHVYILTATLSNRARHAQGYPLLELTLTDLDDQQVLRRLLAPHEYLPATTDIHAGFAAGDELHVKLAFTLDGISATGYRVYVTYP